MSFYVVDVESDGPAPGLFSMVSFGAIKVDRELTTTFKGLVKPISSNWNEDALKISQISRQQHLAYPDPLEVMLDFKQWIEKTSVGKPVFISDNLAFDWQFINYYLHAYTQSNPFGFSGRRIGDIYSGLKKNLRAASEWKKMRKTIHDHDPVNDAKGNAEAFLQILDFHGMKIPT